MSAGPRRPINIAMAAGSLTALVVCLALVDKRVREQIALILSGHVAVSEFGSAFLYIEGCSRAVLQVVRDQSLSHAPLAVFAVAAIVLSLFMTRT